MVRWIRNGPCVGIKYRTMIGWDPHAAIPDNDRRSSAWLRDLNAIIYIHSWLRSEAIRGDRGRNGAGEATPMDVVQLAQRFPEVPIICGHSGGGLGTGHPRRPPQKNVYLEFAGSDPHSGAVDLAVKELRRRSHCVWRTHAQPLRTPPSSRKSSMPT